MHNVHTHFSFRRHSGSLEVAAGTIPNAEATKRVTNLDSAGSRLLGTNRLRSSPPHFHPSAISPFIGHPKAEDLIGRLNAGALPIALLLSPFGDILESLREDSMSFEARIDSPAAVGAIIRARRDDRGLSQQSLAQATGVSRKFLVDLEAGHERAELGKTLSILAALGLTLEAADLIPRGRDHDPARRDYAQTFAHLIGSRDFEFAIKMLADYATASLQAGRPLLQRSPRLKEPYWSAALAGITNYTAHRLGQPAPAWTRRVKPLNAAWMPAESYRSIREPMKQLTMSETPAELAAMNVFIRERSLANA